MNATGMVMLYALAWIGMGAIGLWLARFVDAVCIPAMKTRSAIWKASWPVLLSLRVSITLAIACVVCVVRDVATNKNRQAQEKL